MAERPILFNGPMVRAILDGRKTQTRRLVKPQPQHSLILGAQERPGVPSQWYDADCINPGVEVRCPFGRAGDRLWVRETWALDDCGRDGKRVIWSADRASAWLVRDEALGQILWLSSDYKPDSWRPSIHMPRWASRLLLEVTEVRAQRLQDISEDDAKAEGVELLGATVGPQQAIAGDSLGRRHADHPHTLALAVLWDTIHGKRAGWASNPWVWCVSFRRVEASHG